jgi:hypothetical protein
VAGGFSGTESRFDIRYTSGKADQSLRSDMRIDPSTLGMSVQIPISAYPGRGVNLPVTLNYSSKYGGLTLSGRPLALKPTTPS